MVFPFGEASFLIVFFILFHPILSLFLLHFPLIYLFLLPIFKNNFFLNFNFTSISHSGFVFIFLVYHFRTWSTCMRKYFFLSDVRGKSFGCDVWSQILDFLFLFIHLICGIESLLEEFFLVFLFLWIIVLNSEVFLFEVKVIEVVVHQFEKIITEPVEIFLLFLLEIVLKLLDLTYNMTLIILTRQFIGHLSIFLSKAFLWSFKEH